MINNFKPICKKVSLSHLIVGPGGVAEPLCQTCSHRNCGHPIESIDTSVLGVMKNWRLYSSHGNVFAVIDCDGYYMIQKRDK